ncbi:dipeptidase [Acidobacteriota bacterium]
MKRITVFILIFFSLIFLYGEEYNCFSIIAGKFCTVDGSVMIAHNEDDFGINFVNVHKVPPMLHPNEKIIKLKNGAAISEANKTFGYLWFQVPGQEFADTYMNEKGVIIASNQCTSREDKGELTEGGIGFMLRRITAQRAGSAREAVKIAGELLSKYGYASSGRTYCFADANEGWILHAVKGKHWVAQRVPDDKIVVIANYYTINKVDLSDKENFMGSADIIDYAIKRDWYKSGKDKNFDFAQVYSSPKNLKSMVNILRQWRATNLLAKKNYEIDERFPFSFMPKRKVRLTDLFRVLRDHHEGTEYDLTDDYKKGSPNSTKNRAICDESTQYSFVTTLRSDLPAEVANVAWIAFRRPDSNAYSPWYLSITSPPKGYTHGSPDTDTALRNHFNWPKSFFKFDPAYAFWNYAKLSDLVDQAYRDRVRHTRKEWKNLENFFLKNQKKKEKEFLYLLKKEKNIAINFITNYVHQLEYRKWFLTTELIEKTKKED